MQATNMSGAGGEEDDKTISFSQDGAPFLE